MKPSTPNLSESLLLKYLQQIFKVKGVAECGNFQDAVDLIWEHSEDLHIPEGFDQECILILERMNVRGSIWNLKPSSFLAQVAMEYVDGRYFLVSDSSLSGAESLMLCASGFSDDDNGMHEDISYIVSSWAKHGNPRIIIGGYHDKKNGGYVYLTAAQLASLV